jgi:hypothetical protein
MINNFFGHGFIKLCGRLCEKNLKDNAKLKKWCKKRR